MGALRWALRFLGLVAAQVLAGAGLGAVLYPAVGTLLGLRAGWVALLGKGILDLGFYAFIWAPGVALVCCLMRARREWQSGGGNPRAPWWTLP